MKRSFWYVLAYLTTLVSPAAAQSGFTSVSAGNWAPFTAPGSIIAGFGNGFALTTTSANQLPLPTTLANATIAVQDSAGNTGPAQLFMVAAGQINYLLPANLAVGKATTKVTVGSNSYAGVLQISNVAPAIFAADSSGSGPPAAQVIRVSNGTATADPPPFIAGINGSPAIAAPINLTPFTDSLYLVLYATGISRHSTNPVIAMIGSTKIPVFYAGAQGTEAGLDQINIGPLPRTLAGAGSSPLVVTVDGIPANTMTLNFQ